VIRSMTGFGRSRFEIEGQPFDCELRSVNHRYLDVRVRLPRRLGHGEAELRARLQERVARGKVDLTVAQPETGAAAPRLEVDADAARQYAAAAEKLRSAGIGGDLDVATLLALPGVARLGEPALSSEESLRALLAAVDEATAALDAMREAEGAALERELHTRLRAVRELVQAVDERSHTVQAAVRERLARRIEKLQRETGFLDEGRLHQEVALAADRMDVTEELVRLRSHVEQFEAILASARPGEPVGRRLDFLLQELAREANTVGSKAGDAPIAHRVVELKTEIERIREQVQNVE